jgi:ribosomal protein S18 acetylase RimI-like enzyme
VTDVTVLERLERCYDAIPRVGGAVVEAVGPFELFLRQGPGWQYYARPRLGSGSVTAADVEAVRSRQRALGAPEAIEWVVDVTPSLQAAAEEAGLPVLLAPLMVLDPTALSHGSDNAFLLDPDDPSFADLYAVSTAVAQLGFGSPGVLPGAVGPAERDAAASARPVEPDLLEFVAAGLRSGTKAEAVVRVPGDGIVARGAFQSAVGAAEIVGVATLPSARRQGHGAAVSALLARVALERGNDLVFLSAMDEDVARMYASVGFRRVGTAGIAEP